MPIGQRNPQNEPGTTSLGPYTPTPGGPAAVPNGFATQPSGPSWLRRTIAPVALYVPFLGGTRQVAQLPAPGPGTSYVLERLVVSGGASFLVAIGSSLEAGSAVEFLSTTATSVTQSDPQPWRLGPQDNLYVVWLGSPSSTQGLIVQARVEAAS